MVILQLMAGLLSGVTTRQKNTLLLVLAAVVEVRAKEVPSLPASWLAFQLPILPHLKITMFTLQVIMVVVVEEVVQGLTCCL